MFRKHEMILSDKHIIRLLKKNRLRITPKIAKSSIQSEHIELCLSNKLKSYVNKQGDLSKGGFKTEEKEIGKEGYILKPGEFILGSTLEKVCIPSGYFGFIETKGKIARAGIQIHNSSGHIGSGFCGTSTLEIKNNNNIPIKIYANQKIAQLYIIKMSSKPRSPYNGEYQNQNGPTMFKI